MTPKNDRTQSEQPRPAAEPTPRRRFRIEKLEQRIAPKRGGKGTKNCGLSDGNGSASISGY